MRRDFIMPLVLLLFFFSTSVLAAIPESAGARREMLNYMMGPVQPRQEISREVIRQHGGDLVFFRTYEQTNKRYYAFMHIDSEGDIELAAPGTWVIRRRIEDGAFEQVKIFLQYDESSFIRLVPVTGSRLLRMDVEIAGVALYRSVPVPMTMDRVLTAPFAMIQESTSGVVDWSLVEPDPAEPGYHRIEAVVARLRQLLPFLHDADDGAMDETGQFIFIETLARQDAPGGFNCSGFAKWVVDGFHGPRTGSYIPVEPLKRKHIGFRGTSWSATLEEARDPYFGLDWTRNLALHMYALDRRTTPESLSPGARDVREVRSADRIDNVGYRIEDLHHVLYRLTLLEPGTIYLGSINRSYGDPLVLRQHTHVVVLLPWFDRTGRFRVAVMERNVETSTRALEERYKGDFIHLVRLETGRDFELPTLGGTVHDD